MGTLRWRSVLDERARYCSQVRKARRRSANCVTHGGISTQFLDRAPQRAAVHESVELVKKSKKRSATGLVNAVLRKLIAEKPKGETPSALSANPMWLTGRWTSEFGSSAINRFATQLRLSLRYRSASAMRLHNQSWPLPESE